MARRPGSHEIASRVRGAFVAACKGLEDDGRPLSTILTELLEKDPKGALDTISKFIPKEMLVEATVTQQLDEMPDETLEHEIGRLVAEATPLLTTQGKGSEAEH